MPKLAKSVKVSLKRKSLRATRRALIRLCNRSMKTAQRTNKRLNDGNTSLSGKRHLERLKQKPIRIYEQLLNAQHSNA